MINASEIDILPGVRGDLDESLVSGGPSGLTAILLPLVDKGWIEVCRLVPWTAPDGAQGLQPGPSVPRQELPALLTDAENWEYPGDGEWLGRLTLVLTESGRRVPGDLQPLDGRMPGIGEEGRCPVRREMRVVRSDPAR
ncbi:hypothetical protein ABZ359_36440 [Streptomyces sp. NPDC005968]|uniref:hypothetical protein n=1 Tax=Streptomyces sp. NPDC005968 TaxID=3154574 RepID=UPI0033CFBA45